VRELDLPVLAEVFDRTSLSIGERHRVAAYKIHSTDTENPELIRAVAATGKPLLFSTGGSDLGKVEGALLEARREGNEQAILMHGVQNFPTRIEDSHLRFIGTLKSSFGLPVGFQDHVDGGSPMARILPALALAFGADLVEKHITLDRSARGFDFESALDPAPFREMVELLRQTEKAAGGSEAPAGESAAAYHRLMRRAVVSREKISKGAPLRREQVSFLRNETGLAPLEAARLFGRAARRDIEAWEPLTEELFE
jgi:sialic acid synthase SpsE